jgi:hypothetical protein
VTALLPVVLFLSWFAFVLTPVWEKAIEDERNSVPESERCRTSIFPGFPVMPLLFWGLAWLLDRIISPWGFRSILILHLILLVVSVFVIVRDVLRLRRITKTKT